MFTIVIGATIVGMILGLLGSGGSAIMVPILVYLVGHDAKISIAESMAIVGMISTVGAIPLARAKLIDWQSVILFGVPAMFGTFTGAWLGGLSSDALQLTVFGVVLIFAAALMLKKAFSAPHSKAEGLAHQPSLTFVRGCQTAFQGALVGSLTGFVGVGGGFLIVPALLILRQLPMRTAIGTSLVIITMNSVIGFLKYQHLLETHQLSVDWQTIGMFVAVGMIGCSIGRKINLALDPRLLKQIFAIFLVLVGSFVILQESGKATLPTRENHNLSTPPNDTHGGPSQA